MDRVVIALSLLLAGEFSFAAAKPVLFYKKDGTRQMQSIDLYNEVQVDARCLKAKKKSCAATKALQKNLRPHYGEGPDKMAMNPASLLCKDLGGETVIGSDLQLNQSDYCRFSDGSFFSSGDYFRRTRALNP